MIIINYVNTSTSNTHHRIACVSVYVPVMRPKDQYCGNASQYSTPCLGESKNALGQVASAQGWAPTSQNPADWEQQRREPNCPVD